MQLMTRTALPCTLGLWLFSLALSSAGAAIYLRNATINPATNRSLDRAAILQAQSQARRASQSALGAQLPYIIQLAGPIRPEWKHEIEDIPARVAGYLPNNALLVLLTQAQLEMLARLVYVQWIGPYLPAYKLDPPISQLSNTRAAQRETFTIETFAAKMLPVVRQAILEQHGTIIAEGAVGQRGLLRATLAPAAAGALAELPEVEFIEIYRMPRLCNNLARDSKHMNTQSLWSEHGLSGKGQIVCVADTGLDSGDKRNIHPDFSNRIVAAQALGRPKQNDWSDSSTNQQGGHGTHVAGSVLGSGAAWSNGLYRGVAHQASLVIQSLMDHQGELGGLPADLTNLFFQGYLQGARIHTDSWGIANAGTYDVAAQCADQFMWDIRDMLLIFAAGNEGTDSAGRGLIAAGSVGAPGTAKNVLTVGAAESSRPTGSGGYSAYSYSDAWPLDYPVEPISSDLISSAHDGIHQGIAAFSSRGPCRDGRYKPDLVAPGTDIVSCRSRMPGANVGWGTGSGVLGNAASNYYVFMGGTSMSTPLTAGAAALLRQYLQERRGYAAPSAALMKAILVNGARSLSPGQYGTGPYREIPATRPNNVEGWGQVNLADSLFPPSGSTNLYYDITEPSAALQTGAHAIYSCQGSGSEPIAITLCWSDYPATLAAARQLVNDLDLLVVTPDATVHYPNGLSEPDRLNNTETILLPATQGTIQIRISGYNVPYGPQPYALVIRGAGSMAPPRPAHSFLASDFDGDGLADPAIYAPSAGWYIWPSKQAYLRQGPFLASAQFGAALAADIDGDGFADPILYSAGWWVYFSSANYALCASPYLTSSITGIGLAGDVDGDGKADPALYRASDGWYIWFSKYAYLGDGPFLLGAPNSYPLLADFDGDGLADPALYRASDGWHIWFSSLNYEYQGPGLLGLAGFSALAADFDGDGLADPALYQETTGLLYLWSSANGYSLSGPHGPYRAP